MADGGRNFRLTPLSEMEDYFGPDIFLEEEWKNNASAPDCACQHIFVFYCATCFLIDGPF
jgi:hypothetical protein